MPSWDFTRSNTSMRLLTAFAAEHGLAAERALNGTGVSANQLAATPGGVVAAEQELRLIDNIVEQLGHVPALGVQAGQHYHFTAFGPLGFALVSSRTVRDAVEIGLRYIRLTYAFCSFRLDDDGRQVHVVMNDRELPERLRPFIVERDSACLVTLQRDVFNQPSLLEGLRFSFAEPRHVAPYQAFYTVAPEFGAARNEAILDRARLMQPLPQANAQALQAAEQQCEDLLNQRHQRGNLSAQVRNHLAARAADMPDMTQVAQALHMIPRTLRRRLLHENTRFSELRDEARQTLAEQYLSGLGLSVDQVAARLGYAEASSFIKAYKRWHGVTPHAYRLDRSA